MYCRRLNLPAVKLLVRGGHAPDVVDSEGRGALWFATLPNRRGLGRNLGFDVLVRRVRGDIEPELRGELVKFLVNAGVRVNQGVLDNLSTSLPSLGMEAEDWMRTPPSLLTCARSAVWAAVWFQLYNSRALFVNCLTVEGGKYKKCKIRSGKAD